MKTVPAIFCIGAAISVAALAPSNAATPIAYQYDANNQLARATYPDGQQVVYTYDDMGNILTITSTYDAPPAVIVADPIAGAVGHPIADYTILANRPADVTGFSVKGLPGGLKANAGNIINADGKPPGTIYGTPTAGGTFKIEVAAIGPDGPGIPAIITANIKNPFAGVEDGFGLAGGYSGYIDPSAVAGAEDGGWFTLKNGAGGLFSGSLLIGGKKYGFAGQFDGQTGKAATITIAREAPLGDLTLDLNLGLQGAERGMLTATIGDGSNSNFFYLYREVWGKTNPAAAFGGKKSAAYNVVLRLPVLHWNIDTYPQGYGYAIITVDRMGKAKLAGKLADGTGISFGSVIWPDGNVTFHIPLYGGKGVFAGYVTVGAATELATGDNTASGDALWKKPVSTKARDTLYAAGFSTAVEIKGGAYTAPGKGERVLGLGSEVAHDYVRMDLFRGGLPGTIRTQLTLSTANKVTLFNPNNYAFKLSFSPGSGLFSGEFAFGSPARKPKITGLIVPDNIWDFNDGAGFFLLPGAAPGDPTLSGNAWIGQPLVP